MNWENAEEIVRERYVENAEENSGNADGLTEGENTCDKDACERDVKHRHHPKPDNEIPAAAAVRERVCVIHGLQ